VPREEALSEGLDGLPDLVLSFLLVTGAAGAQAPSLEGPGRGEPLPKEPSQSKAAQGGLKGIASAGRSSLPKSASASRRFTSSFASCRRGASALLDRLRAMGASERKSFIRKAEAELEKIHRAPLAPRATGDASKEAGKAESASARSSRACPEGAARVLEGQGAVPAGEDRCELARAAARKGEGHGSEGASGVLEVAQGRASLEGHVSGRGRAPEDSGLASKADRELVRTPARKEKGTRRRTPEARFVSEETWKRWLALKPYERPWPSRRSRMRPRILATAACGQPITALEVDSQRFLRSG